MVEEEKAETGNTARAFVNGVWVDDNEKFACKLQNTFSRTFKLAIGNVIRRIYLK